MKYKFEDDVGNTFGYLTVQEELSVAGNRQSVRYYKCLCKCGEATLVKPGDLHKGYKRSCGCLQIESASVPPTNKTHGLTGTPPYKAWQGAKERCSVEKRSTYMKYGGRGITMSKEWFDSFDAFWEDMSGTYAEGLSLDRIDVNGNYCKENCRWADNSVQSHNQRKREGKSSTYRGVSLSSNKKVWVSSICKDGEHIYLGRFEDEYIAATAYDNASELIYGDRPNKTIRTTE